MYNTKSSIAEEFIADSEIKESLEFANANAQNTQYLNDILVKASKYEGLTHREAITLLECEDKQIINKVFKLAKEIKQKFYGNRIVMFAPLYLSNY